MLQKVKKEKAKLETKLTNDESLKNSSLKGGKALQKLKKVELDNQISQVLLDAADLIEKKGWCRNELLNHGRVCLLGAIGSVSGPIEGRNEYERMGCIQENFDCGIGEKAARRLSDFLGNDVAIYNDYDCPNGKTAAEKLRKAAKVRGESDVVRQEVG